MILKLCDLDLILWSAELFLASPIAVGDFRHMKNFRELNNADHNNSTWPIIRETMGDLRSPRSAQN
jgi:hypothetical protein